MTVNDFEVKKLPRNNALFRQCLTRVEKNGLLSIMPSTSHCNLCGNLDRTGNITNGLPSHSAPYLVNL